MAKRRDNSKTTDTTVERLPGAELEVLACLWHIGEATARQVRETMGTYRPMTHGSMVTLLKRLEAKDMVAREKGTVGKAFVYRPTKSARPMHRRIIRDVVQRIFGGNGVEMVSTLLDTKPPTARELDQLQELLSQLRTRNKSHEDAV